MLWRRVVTEMCIGGNSERLLFTNTCRIVTAGGVMGYFKASTQYGDWKGTAAADDPQSSLRELLADKGLIKPGEFLIAATLHVSEPKYTSVRAFVFQNGENIESVWGCPLG